MRDAETILRHTLIKGCRIRVGEVRWTWIAWEFEGREQPSLLLVLPVHCNPGTSLGLQ